MASKASSINKELESAIKSFLKQAKDSGDLKDLSMAINCSIKWEAVKLKMADQDFGSHFGDEPELDDEVD